MQDAIKLAIYWASCQDDNPADHVHTVAPAIARLAQLERLLARLARTETFDRPLTPAEVAAQAQYEGEANEHARTLGLTIEVGDPRGCAIRLKGGFIDQGHWYNDMGGDAFVFAE